MNDWKWPGEGLEWIPIPREGDKPIIIRKCYSILTYSIDLRDLTITIFNSLSTVFV